MPRTSGDVGNTEGSQLTADGVLGNVFPWKPYRQRSMMDGADNALCNIANVYNYFKWKENGFETKWIIYEKRSWAFESS